MTERKGMDVHDKTWLAISRGKKRVTSERDEVLPRTGLAATVVGRRRVVVPIVAVVLHEQEK